MIMRYQSPHKNYIYFNIIVYKTINHAQWLKTFKFIVNSKLGYFVFISSQLSLNYLAPMCQNIYHGQTLFRQDLVCVNLFFSMCAMRNYNFSKKPIVREMDATIFT
jgi:hypothetical protein